MFEPFSFYGMPNTLFGVFLGILLVGLVIVCGEMFSNKTQTVATVKYKIPNGKIQYFSIEGIECIAIDRYGISCDWQNRKAEK